MSDLLDPVHASSVIELTPDPEMGGFTARMPDIPAYGEGETEAKAIADLEEALRGYIHTFGMDDALSRLVAPQLRPAPWALRDLAGA